MKAGTEAAFEGEDGGERGKDINNIMNQTKTATKKKKKKKKTPQRKKVWSCRVSIPVPLAC